MICQIRVDNKLKVILPPINIGNFESNNDLAFSKIDVGVWLIALVAYDLKNSEEEEDDCCVKTVHAYNT